MKCRSIIFAMAIVLVGAIAFAQELSNTERIEEFSAHIVVNSDNSVDVTEILRYNTGSILRHGIYRDIYPYSSEGRKMTITDVSVIDENGTPYRFQRSSSGSNVRLKIGDPDTTFKGYAIYVIRYRATNAVAHLAEHDEIYWNVTGNEWTMPIMSTSVSIELPGQTVVKQSACYFGPKGNTSRCGDVDLDSNKFSSPGVLNSGEGLTVAVGFPKGVVAEYPPSFFSDTVKKYLVWGVSALLPIVVFIVMILKWRRKGRDPKGTGVIIPQYDISDGLTPLEVSCIVGKLGYTKAISAEIVYLAVRGYVKIRQIENKVLGIFNTTDYQFVLQKDYSDLQNDFDQKLLDGIFSGNREVGASVLMKNLKNKFYVHIKTIFESLRISMLAKAYYTNLPKTSTVVTVSSFFTGFIIGFCIFFNIADGISKLAAEDVVFVASSIIISFLIYIIISALMPAKSQKGVATKEYILGLKDYLQIAEKDRLAFHYAPEKKPELFERLLPYAMVLGVDAAWAKEFQDIYTTPPDWYEGAHAGTFNAVIFSHSLSGFSSFASSAMTSRPGGSGGGGFSGGGGGGGGGGGW